MVTRWSRDGHMMVTGWPRIGHGMVTVWSRDGHEMVTGWSWPRNKNERLIVVMIHIFNIFNYFSMFCRSVLLANPTKESLNFSRR